MKLTKRLIALTLTGVLMLGGLTACGKVEANLPEYDSETLDTTTITDLTEFLLGVPGDTAVATLNGVDVTADELAYWIVVHCDSLQQNAYQSTGSLTIPWDADMGDGLTLEGYVRKAALDLAVTQRMVDQMAEKDGIAMTAEQQTQVQEILDGVAAEGQQIGASLDQYLNLSMALDEEMFRWNWKCDFAYEALSEARFGGENAPAAQDILSWMEEEAGFYSVKHILLATKDTTTNVPLSAEQAKEKRAVADDLLARLLAAEDPIALFDTLMNEYSEDPGLVTNPNGYTFQTNTNIDPAFESVAISLEPGQISDVVTGVSGYHIILRLPLEADPEQYRDAYVRAAMPQLVAGLVEQAELKTTDFCDEVDVQDVHERMTAFRNRFGQPAVEQVQPDEGDSAPVE